MKTNELFFRTGCMVLSGVLAGALSAGGGDVYISGGTTIIEDGQRVTSVDDFREPLAGHGQWLETEEYGRAWQPTVVAEDPSWRPYCHGGQWVWTDRGWYWQSTYAWGWAPFHYGRWACGRHGWVWVPDVVWAPAWVEWRRSETHVGWAPVCAEPRRGVSVGFFYRSGGFSFGVNVSDEDRYCFVPERRFEEVQVVSYVVPCEARTVIYRESARTVYVRHGEARGHEEPRRYEEPPRNTRIEGGRRTDHLQEQFGSPRPSEVAWSRTTADSGVRDARKPQAPVVYHPANVVRQDAGSRIQAIQQRSPQVASRTSALSDRLAAVQTRKPLVQIMKDRGITQNQVNAAVARIPSAEKRKMVSAEIQRRLKENR